MPSAPCRASKTYTTSRDINTTDINIHNAVGDNEPIAYEAAAQWMQAWRPEAQHRA
jgi:hypothetical protein